MKKILLIIAFAAFVTSGAIAQTPAPSATTQDPNAATTSSAAGTKTGVAPAATTAATTPTATDAKPKKPFKRPPGYRMAKRNGITYYCRKDASIGSRVETTKCFTQEQLEEMSMVNSESVEASQQAMRVCVNPLNCGGM